MIILDEESVVPVQAVHNVKSIRTWREVDNLLLLEDREESVGVDSDNSKRGGDRAQGLLEATTTPAEVSSGRSDDAVLSSTHVARPASPVTATFSTGALPVAAAAVKAAVRTVKTFFASPDFTV